MTDNPLASALRPLRQRWWVVVGLVVLALAVTWVTLPDRTSDGGAAEGAANFRATHLLIRNGAAPAQLSFDLIQLLARQGELTNRVSERMGPEVTAAEVAAVELLVDPLTETIAVTAIRPTEDGAAEFATTYAEELVAFLDERNEQTIENDYQRVTQRIAEIEASVGELEADIGELPEDDLERRLLEADLAALLTEYSELRGQERSLADQRDGQADSFVTLEPPSPVPVEEEETITLPVRPALRLGLAAFLAAVLGIGVAIVVDRLDTRIRTRREAEEAFGLPVIAELPRRSRRHLQSDPLPAYTDPGGVSAETFRALRLSIALAPTWHLTSLPNRVSGVVGGKSPVKLEHEPRSIVVTSALTGDGKTSLAANLAVSIAEGGRRVLVVDCDFRRPTVGKLLEVDSGLGLRELAHVDERPLRNLASPTVAPNVAMIRSGSRGVTPSWFMREAKTLVERCVDMADVVVFDTGPVTLTNEASALLPHVDTALLVGRAGKVAADQARGAVEQLTQVGAHVSGVVLVGASGPRRYGYGYYRPDGEVVTDSATREPDTSEGRRSGLADGELWDESDATGGRENGQGRGSRSHERDRASAQDTRNGPSDSASPS
jgi:capsular exopolysaccharide synthesis family protein